jgi:hypothetical protein
MSTRDAIAELRAAIELAERIRQAHASERWRAALAAEGPDGPAGKYRRGAGLLPGRLDEMLAHEARLHAMRAELARLEASPGRARRAA